MPLPRRSADDQVTATFLRGLTIGALVGAVVAGSSMLSRRRARSAASGPARPVVDRPVATSDPATDTVADRGAPRS